MKSVIYNPFTPIPKSIKSHVRGWSIIWGQRLNAKIYEKGDDLSSFDTIYLDHGVNFSGSLNLFGGANAEVANRCQDLLSAIKSGTKLIYLDAYFDYPAAILARKNAASTDKRFKSTLLSRLQSVMVGPAILTMSDLPLTDIIIGDSHSTAFSQENQIVIKKNGQLLFSALRDGKLDRWCRDYMRRVKKLKSITICLGSIDIRFHALKPERLTAKKYALWYAAAVDKIATELRIPISVCAAVPIEHEGRRIPKTGQHQGSPFYGSRDERLAYTLEFNHTLSKTLCVVKPPAIWYKLPGEQYAEEIMELNSSVHIAPSNYRSVRGWPCITNTK